MQSSLQAYGEKKYKSMKHNSVINSVEAFCDIFSKIFHFPIFYSN